MAVINESEFGRITAIYERQAQACVRSVEDFYDEITELSRKTAYEPLVNFTNQIYEFYKGELRDHLRREFANWYDSEYSLHALARSILAGEDAVRNARGHMDVMGEHLDQMFRRGPNPIHVDTGEPRIQDQDFDTFAHALSVCVRRCQEAGQEALGEINGMAAENNAVSCIIGFVKTTGLSMTESFRSMINRVDDGLRLFRQGVNHTVNAVPTGGKGPDVHLPWGKGIPYM